MNTVLLEKLDGYAVVTLQSPGGDECAVTESARDFVAAFPECTKVPAIRVVDADREWQGLLRRFDLKELGQPIGNSADEADNLVAQAMKAFCGRSLARSTATASPEDLRWRWPATS